MLTKNLLAFINAIQYAVVRLCFPALKIYNILTYQTMSCLFYEKYRLGMNMISLLISFWVSSIMLES